MVQAAEHTPGIDRKKALIFRITHRDNVPWILDHGLHAATSRTLDPSFVSIGSSDVISKRKTRKVPQPPYGTLADYVPFYFTPRTPMMLNITTGYYGLAKRSMEEIVIVVSSLHDLGAQSLQFLFTDRHAIYSTAQFFTSLSQIDEVPWSLLQKGDFSRDPDDPERFERYQAEALVFQHVPLGALKGIVCYNEAVQTAICDELELRSQQMRVEVYRRWFF